MDNFQFLPSLNGLLSEAPTLVDLNLVNARLPQLVIGPGRPPESAVTVKRCTFSRCTVEGNFAIYPGAVLHDVTFEDTSSPDVMIVGTETVLRRVVVRGGKRSSSLFVKPMGTDQFGADRKRELDAWIAAQEDSESLMLDFADLHADVEVIGLPLAQLRWDPARHVAWKATDVNRDVCKKLGFPSNSYVSLTSRRLSLFGAGEGVWAHPDSSSRKYSQFVDEVDRLRREGLLTIISR